MNTHTYHKAKWILTKLVLGLGAVIGVALSGALARPAAPAFQPGENRVTFKSQFQGVGLAVANSVFQPGENRVTFKSQGVPMVGMLYLPASYRDGQKLPLVIVTGSWTSVKEQMAGLYARRLGQQGLAAMAFDFRGFGESGGTPRQLESARLKEQDIWAAAEFARALPVTSPDQIGGLAVCASAGYMAHAIADGAPIRSFATVKAWLHDSQNIGQLYNGDRSVSHFLSESDRARQVYERTGQVEYVPANSTTDRRAAMVGAEYYSRPDRGGIPQWDNRFPVMAWREWLAFDAISVASRIRVPTLMVHTDRSAPVDGARRFYAGLAGPKNLFWTQGLGMDFYDREPYVTVAVQAVTNHFHNTLAGGLPAPGEAR